MNLFLLALVTLGVVVLSEVYALIEARRAAEPAIQAAIPYQLFQSGGKALLVLGDSTAYGVGTTVPEETTAGRLALALSLTHVENYSASGAVTAEVMAQARKATLPYYDYVLVQVGANDVISPRRSLTNAAAELETVVKDLRPKSGTMVLLTSGDIGKAPVWPWPLNWVLSYRTSVLREKFMAVARAHDVVYVDLFTAPTNFSSDPERFYAKDGLHLSGEGYAVWAGYILDAVRNYEEARRAPR